MALYSCSNRNTKESTIPIPRDTSITSSIAYTHLVLDSMRVEGFIAGEIPRENDARRIRDFYNGRNYQFAWFDEQGLTEQAALFWNLCQMHANELKDSSLQSRQFGEDMDSLSSNGNLPVSETALEKTELGLTVRFFKYLNVVLGARISPEEMGWHIPKRKIDEKAVLDSFLSNRQGEWRPLNHSYYELQRKLNQYVSIAKGGGWPAIELKKNITIKTGGDSIIRMIKKRLRATGSYSPGDSSDVFDKAFAEAIKSAQGSYGLKETGIIDAPFITALNVPVNERIKQLNINLERMRWMPKESQDEIVANIPGFKLHVYEKGREAFNMNIVVGKSAHQTVIFSDQLKYIVFSPYWNVPRSIVRNEIQPAIIKSGSYLRRNNMEITGYSNGLPVVRQKPGKGNALGRVKFIFPNRFNIYFHDTPAKHLFAEQKRAFSHGCIRLQAPFKLAKYLLRNDSNWTAKKIDRAMHGSRETWVTLARPVPVFIVYFTSWVDDNGVLQFRDDIYGRDKRMEQHLFK